MTQATYWKADSGTFNAGFYGPAFVGLTEYQAMHAADALNMAKLARSISNKMPRHTSRNDAAVHELQALHQQVSDLCRIALISELEVYTNPSVK